MPIDNSSYCCSNPEYRTEVHSEEYVIFKYIWYFLISNIQDEFI